MGHVESKSTEYWVTKNVQISFGKFIIRHQQESRDEKWYPKLFTS